MKTKKVKICQECKKEYTTRGIKYCLKCGYEVNRLRSIRVLREKRESETRQEKETGKRA